MTSQHGFVERLAELSAQRQPFVCVTIVDTQGSVPHASGGKMLVNRQGLVFGTIGGGRVENQAIHVAQTLLADENPSAQAQLVAWNLKRDVGMTCGGSVSLYFETYYHQLWSIVIFGAGHVACAVAQCLNQLNCKLKVIDPRPEWLSRLPTSERVEKVQADAPETHVSQLTNSDYVLVMTMGHRTDLPILEQIFRRNLELPYLGVIGSRAKHAALKKELMAAGLDASCADRFRCPIGLPIGNNEPHEIAISVAAELLQTRDMQSAKRSKSYLSGQRQQGDL